MVFSKDKAFFRELFTLALPIALGSLVSFSVSLSDNMIISKLGGTAVSAVFLGNQVAFLLTMLVTGVESALIVVESHIIGKGELEGAKCAASYGIIFALAISLPFFALSVFAPRLLLSFFTNETLLIEAGVPFIKALGFSFLFFAPAQALAAVLRSIKKPKTAFFASVLAFAVNLFLDFGLVFGKMGFPRLDILGAGIATLVARVVEFLFSFVYAFFIDRELGLRIGSVFKFERDAFALFFKKLAPLEATQLVWSVNAFFATRVMGREGGAVVAGLSVASSLYNLSYVVTAGVSGALSVIIGRALAGGGCDSGHTFARFSHKTQLIAVFLGVLTAIFMQAVKSPFSSLWDLSGIESEYARALISVLSFMVIGTAYQSVMLNGFIRSTGEVGFIFKFESLSVFCLIIPFSLLASRLGASPILLFAILKCDQLAKCPVAYFKMKKIRKRLLGGASLPHPEI